jgi:Holliday junction resolvase-like predicted endonuclease
VNSVRFGTIGEARAITEFLKLGYTVYTPFSEGNDPFDFIAVKDNKLIRVEVKSSSQEINTGVYTISIKSSRHNKSKNWIRNFDPKQCDILAVYIQPIDTMCFFRAKDVTNKTNITIKKQPSKSRHHKNLRQWFIDDYIDLESTL